MYGGQGKAAGYSPGRRLCCVWPALTTTDLLNVVGNKFALMRVVTLRGVALTIPDYVAIGVLIALLVWAVAEWIPRCKL
jgi:hypothetical protein